MRAGGGYRINVKMQIKNGKWKAETLNTEHLHNNLIVNKIKIATSTFQHNIIVNCYKVAGAPCERLQTGVPAWPGGPSQEEMIMMGVLNPTN
jgi:hypothetical protein